MPASRRLSRAARRISIGLILIILLVIFLLGGFSGRFGGYGYGYGHGGVSLICIVLAVVVVMSLMGRPLPEPCYSAQRAGGRHGTRGPTARPLRDPFALTDQ